MFPAKQKKSLVQKISDRMPDVLNFKQEQGNFSM